MPPLAESNVVYATERRLFAQWVVEDHEDWKGPPAAMMQPKIQDAGEVKSNQVITRNAEGEIGLG